MLYEKPSKVATQNNHSSFVKQFREAHQLLSVEKVLRLLLEDFGYD
jgi:hypothetical protein